MKFPAIALAHITAPTIAQVPPPDDWPVLSAPRLVTEVVTRIGAGGATIGYLRSSALAAHYVLAAGDSAIVAMDKAPSKLVAAVTAP